METDNTISRQGGRTSSFVQEYLDYLQTKKNRSAMTLDSYAKDLSQFLDFVTQQNDVAVDQQILGLSREAAQKFIDHLMARQFSISTIGRKVTAIRGFYKYLINSGRIGENPFEHTYVPQRETPHLEFLNPQQLNQLFTAIDDSHWLGQRDRAIVALLYNTGMRVSELLALTTADVDMDKCTVAIHAAGHKTRKCRLQDWVGKAIRRYLEGRQLQGICDAPKTDCIFVNRDGDLLTARSIRRKLKQYSHQAGLPIEAGPAILRHSCAMHLLMEGADVKSLRAKLGHLSASSMRPYLECLEHMEAPKEPAAVDLIGI